MSSSSYNGKPSSNVNNKENDGNTYGDNKKFLQMMTAMTLTSASVAAAYLTFKLKRKKAKALLEQKERDENKARLDAFRNLAKLSNNDNDDNALSSSKMGKLLPSIKIDEVYLWEVEYLGKKFPSEVPSGHVNLMRGVGKTRTIQTHYNRIIKEHECILAKVVRKPSKNGSNNTTSIAYVRAGPRKDLHFYPESVNAAIVTCGGLCPGLNNVVREITHSLYRMYGIKGKVWGVRGGYKGFHDPSYPPMELTPENVEDIHHYGGTVLSSSRGGFDLDKTLHFIKKYEINQVYVIGGDGTHRGAFRLHEGCMENNMNVAVAGIPKTIDNDVDYIDRSFGFTSAVEAAQKAIHCAKTEASCNLPNGIGIVKLMGRSAGFIAAHATLGSGDVDLCLVPEVPTLLEGPLGCLPHIFKRVKQKGYAVVVVAEGAGEDILGESTETDASGNKKLPPIGEFMKKSIDKYFHEQGEAATVKYIDPSYMIRSVPANAADSLYCMQLAQNAVHGAMAGFTGFSVGLCNNKMVFLPIPELCSTSPRMMDPYGRTWERILAQTHQPNTVPTRESLQTLKKKVEDEDESFFDSQDYA
eukprot:CAMPEP_0184866258 /NCGR_PEP_ID=MMETSP0580-20130426/21555_1 /TAXON_ID=1118495 /ORGANISM="Dactyliosolen fragilissimus" /LENGTH=582 /DNA_ID=CAMNT_0027365843 /DNA_START=45 /DNA_END=1793 /DNA_ORIENTATION=+